MSESESFLLWMMASGLRYSRAIEISLPYGHLISGLCMVVSSTNLRSWYRSLICMASITPSTRRIVRTGIVMMCKLFLEDWSDSPREFSTGFASSLPELVLGKILIPNRRVRPGDFVRPSGEATTTIFIGALTQRYGLIVTLNSMVFGAASISLLSSALITLS